jgi:hypothetical protein
MIRHSLALCLLVFSAPLASAQGIAVFRSAEKEIRTLRVRGIPSPQEAKYLRYLAQALGESSDTSVVQVPYSESDLGLRPGSPANLSDQVAKGVAARVGGVDVQRLRFRSADHAQRFAIYAAPTLETPTMVEVRGNQVVIARGERVSKPEDLERIRRAAWGVLHHAPGAPSVAGVVLSMSEFSYESRVRNEDLDAFVDGAIVDAQGRPGATIEGGRATVVRERHRSSAERHSGDLVTLWVAQGRNIQDPERMQAIGEGMLARSNALAAAVEPGEQPATEAPRKGTKGKTTPATLNSRQGIGQAIRGLGDYSKVKRP